MHRVAQSPYHFLRFLDMKELASYSSYWLYVIVIPCMQRLHQFYQLEPKGVARGREQIKTDAAFAYMVQLIYS